MNHNTTASRPSCASWVAAAVAAGLSLLIFIPAALKAPFPVLLADRIAPGLGWVEIGLLSAYAVLLAVKLSSASDTRKIRLAIWLTFSIVFFLQFVLGVLGIEGLLMTGSLHVPVPAVVIAGPIYRGERFFMPILFISTIVLAGPSWCSFLCYFGAWDGLAANRKPRAASRGTFWAAARVTLLIIVPLAAIVLRTVGISGIGAAWVAAGFGVAGLGVSGLVSARRGSMIHCTGYCPLGLIANVIGKVSPFRIRITESCTQCGRCSAACRYGALEMARIRCRRPGITCSLCGDCLSSCSEDAIVYSLMRLKPEFSKAIFMGVVAALHACFLGIARI